MHALLAIGLSLLGGCMHTPPETNIDGIWINQPTIDAAALGQPLNIHGTPLEWHIDTRMGKAQVRNGFEMDEGQLLRKAADTWTVDYGDGHTDELRLDGKQLIQETSQHMSQQAFNRPPETVKTGGNWVNTFVKALNAAYMAGEWRIVEGPGKGTTAMFTPEGRVSGLGNADRYTLCLDGDCRSQGSGNETLLLSGAGDSDTWIFVRKGKRMEIFNAINLSAPDEIPQLRQGAQHWLLEKR